MIPRRSTSATSAAEDSPEPSISRLVVLFSFPEKIQANVLSRTLKRTTRFDPSLINAPTPPANVDFPDCTISNDIVKGSTVTDHSSTPNDTVLHPLSLVRKPESHDGPKTVASSSRSPLSSGCKNEQEVAFRTSPKQHHLLPDSTPLPDTSRPFPTKLLDTPTINLQNAAPSLGDTHQRAVLVVSSDILCGNLSLRDKDGQRICSASIVGSTPNTSNFLGRISIQHPPPLSHSFRSTVYTLLFFYFFSNTRNLDRLIHPADRLDYFIRQDPTNTTYDLTSPP
jgi:hypothetical protein